MYIPPIHDDEFPSDDEDVVNTLLSAYRPLPARSFFAPWRPFVALWLWLFGSAPPQQDSRRDYWPPPDDDFYLLNARQIALCLARLDRYAPSAELDRHRKILLERQGSLAEQTKRRGPVRGFRVVYPEHGKRWRD